MYSDIFDQVTGGGGRRGGGRSTLSGNDSAVAANASETIAVRFKAGIVDLMETGSDEADSPKKFRCVAKPARGEVRLVKSTSETSPSFSWQWYDRTLSLVEETSPLLPDSVDGDTHTFERIALPEKKIHELDRVYVWTHIPKNRQEPPVYKMYWMQDADESKDEEIVTSVHQFLAEVATAAASTGAASQVDALSSILENLGMPQTSSASSIDTNMSGMEAAATTSSGFPPSTVRNQLTLADLQGAMASVQQQLPLAASATTVGPPLQDIVSLSAVDAILENPEASQRLIQFLPPDQQSVEYLRDNLNSSSIQSTLRALTQMLLPNPDSEDGNVYSGYSNLIANFQLDASDGESALLREHNPIQAFLNCIVAAVEKEKNDQEENQADDDKMHEDTDDNNNEEL
jgi:UCH-binding domain